MGCDMHRPIGGVICTVLLQLVACGDLRSCASSYVSVDRAFVVIHITVIRLCLIIVTSWFQQQAIRVGLETKPFHHSV